MYQLRDGVRRTLDRARLLLEDRCMYLVRSLAVLAVVAFGCGGSRSSRPDGGAVQADAMVATRADATVAGQAGGARRVVSGAGHLTGGAYKLDVIVGTGVSQGVTSSGATRVDGEVP
jgi:hypothetical protein